MKKIIWMLCWLSFSVNAQEKQMISSEIKEVTVYLQAAQVSRTFNATLKKGKTDLAVVKLPARIKEKSIQVSTRSEGVKVLSVNSKLNYLETQQKSEEINRIEQLLEKEKEQLAQAQSLLQVFIEEESLLKQNKVIGGQQSGINVEDLKSLAQYFRERLREIALKKLGAAKEN